MFAALDPDAFERCFLAWMSALVEVAGGKLVAIDGKAIRRSFGHAWDKSGMAHLVSAFVSRGGNRLVFGQLAVEDKSNEITAIPRLLALLDLKGAVVTIDAIGCQREIAGQIVAGGGDYAAAGEGQPADAAQEGQGPAGRGGAGRVRGHDATGHFEQASEGHGRVETRRVWVTDEVRWLGRACWACGRGWPAGASRGRADAAGLGGPSGQGDDRAGVLHLQPRRGPTPRRFAGCRAGATGRWRTTCTGSWT